MVQIKNLSKHFKLHKKSFFGKDLIVKAVDNISFNIPEGTTLGMVGESGSGKTTAARSILRLIEPDNGDIIIDNTNITQLKKEEIRKFRRHMQLVFQDPYGSLNPRMTIGKLILEPLKIHKKLSKQELNDRLDELLLLVGMKPEHKNRYPHEFSGGQRQRICIARAIALNPKFIILDEPVSALDVSIQGQILNLLMDLQDKLKLTYLFVAHDLAVVEHISHNIAVMYLGNIVEQGPRDAIYENPLHPYTENLLKSIPKIKAGQHGFSVLKGEIPSPEDPPTGCHFNPRCPKAMPICKEKYPELKINGNSQVACHLY